ANTRPYEVLPIQWSDHIERADGTLDHAEYLSRDARDAREELVVALLEALGREGSICVYSSYERSILERMAEIFPALRPNIRKVIARLWDLHEVVKMHYFHPDFGGSYSIKTVLPAVVPSLSYEDLEIRDGGVAAREYYRMVFELSDWVERTRIEEALLRYCARDTLAMVELRRELTRKVSARDLPV
ncbi:MAG: DUF2779 domain-containing protein, partial [Nitrospiraceae bacterium]